MRHSVCTVTLPADTMARMSSSRRSRGKRYAGDAIAHHAAELLAHLEHMHLMSHKGAEVCAGQGQRGPPPTMAIFLPGGRGGGRCWHLICGELVHRELLDAANVDRGVNERAGDSDSRMDARTRTRTPWGTGCPCESCRLPQRNRPSPQARCRPGTFTCAGHSVSHGTVCATPSRHFPCLTWLSNSSLNVSRPARSTSAACQPIAQSAVSRTTVAWARDLGRAHRARRRTREPLRAVSRYGLSPRGTARICRTFGIRPHAVGRAASPLHTCQAAWPPPCARTRPKTLRTWRRLWHVARPIVLPYDPPHRLSDEM